MISVILLLTFVIFFFFFNDTATTEIYTLSLHDALPISFAGVFHEVEMGDDCNDVAFAKAGESRRDRKSTRLNSSHLVISYAVFCLKKKKDRGSTSPASATRTSPGPCCKSRPQTSSPNSY